MAKGSEAKVMGTEATLGHLQSSTFWGGDGSSGECWGSENQPRLGVRVSPALPLWAGLIPTWAPELPLQP